MAGPFTSRRLLLAAGFVMGGAEAANCNVFETPSLCLSQNCTWLMLDGQCKSSTDPAVAKSPPSCCASAAPASACTHHSPDLFDGDCAVLPPNSTLSSVSSEFNLDAATRMLHLAGAAYCSSDQVKAWSCGTHCASVMGISEQVYITNALQNLAAFVAWDSVSNAMVVSFRGTLMSSITDWLRDISFIKTYPLSQYPSAGVHRGFWNAWEELEQDVVAALGNLASYHETTAVIVTGHSMGAAIAGDAAISLKLKHGYDTTVVNFEAPRTGNQQFMSALRQEVPNFFRITHANDFVPHAPPEAFGFYHAATEVFFPSSTYTDLTHTICDGSGEDPTCSDKCSGSRSCTSLEDHLNLMGFTLGSDQCGGGASVVVV